MYSNKFDFIRDMAECSQKAYKELGKVLPSVCIAMACVECGYGTAGSVKYHSYLGQKVGTGKTATKYWGGKFFNSKTKEEYQIGVHTTIKDNFRSYDSMEQCVFNYYELLNTSLYKRVQSGVDYATQMKQIKECGYMTSSTEVNSVISIIKTYNLTQYDPNGAVEPQKQAVASKVDNVSTKSLPTLKLGMKDAELGANYIASWQTYLKELGYYVGKVDGIYGTLTFNAVFSYESALKKQGKYDGALDGIVGAKCWASLPNKIEG